MAVIERKRPVKTFRVIRAHGCYQKGAIIQPTGMYRDQLLRMRLIEEIHSEPIVTAAEAELPLEDRMVPSRRSRR